MLIAAAGAFPNPQVEALEQAGQTVVAVMQDGVPMGMLALRDTLRDDAKDAVDALHRLGVQGVILTGDNPRAAAAIAGELGLEFKAGLLPADKVSAVTELNGHAPLAMVGDGINDAPAMKASTIGIAMGSGTDVALETADAALTHNRLTGLAQMISLGAGDAGQYSAEHRHCAGSEGDFPGHHAARHDRTVAGGAGGYGGDSAGYGERVAAVAPKVKVKRQPGCRFSCLPPLPAGEGRGEGIRPHASLHP